MKVFLQLGRKWKLNSIAEVVMKVQKIEGLTTACELDLLEIWAEFLQTIEQLHKKIKA
jgi:hypothetical protein